MEVLARWALRRKNKERSVELLFGDLARLPDGDRTDLLVVSAFQNDYLPTAASLIGALGRVGVSLEDLAKDKRMDLRQQYSCWISKSLGTGFPVRHILCIESGWKGSPPQIVDDIFTTIATFVTTEFAEATIAMPIIGTGDQGWPVGVMIQKILGSWGAWVRRGLPLRTLKIVTNRGLDRGPALQAFDTAKEQIAQASHCSLALRPPGQDYDVFISYCHEDIEYASLIRKCLEKKPSSKRIFFAKDTLEPGESWEVGIAKALDNSKRVACMYTPGYWRSHSCHAEFSAAFARQKDTGESVLFPIYLASADIPYYFRSLQYVDCREKDRGKLRRACERLSESLKTS